MIIGVPIWKVVLIILSWELADIIAYSIEKKFFGKKKGGKDDAS